MNGRSSIAAPARTTGLARRALVIVAVAAAVAAGALAWQAGTVSPEVSAFDQTWTWKDCTGSVLPSRRKFLDDAPGAGENNDAAFLFVEARTTSNESCRWFSNLSVNTTQRRTLRVRAAVNDLAKFRVQAFDGQACDGTLLGHALYIGSTSVPANGSFVSVDRTLDIGTVRSVCLVLDDIISSHAQRISALIDDIQIRGTTAIGWQETFSTPG